MEVISNLILSDVGLTLDPLLPTQREAVTCDCEPLLVLGAAGTGKTRTLEGRLLWFVEQGCRPERVLLVTPSEARADATRAHLERVLAGGYDELFVISPVELAALILSAAGPGVDPLEPVLGPAERFAMLLERIASCRSSGTTSAAAPTPCWRGSSAGSTGSRRISSGRGLRAWAERLAESDAEVEREFAEVYRVHEQMLARWGARRRRPDPRCAARDARAAGGVAAGSSTCSSTTRTISTWRRRR